MEVTVIKLVEDATVTEEMVKTMVEMVMQMAPIKIGGEYLSKSLGDEKTVNLVKRTSQRCFPLWIPVILTIRWGGTCLVQVPHIHRIRTTEYKRYLVERQDLARADSATQSDLCHERSLSFSRTSHLQTQGVSGRGG
jgi:hypothetical protein